MIESSARESKSRDHHLCGSQPSWAESKAQPARASRGTPSQPRPVAAIPDRKLSPREQVAGPSLRNRSWWCCWYRKLSPREQVAGLTCQVGFRAARTIESSARESKSRDARDFAAHVSAGPASKAQPARASRGTPRSMPSKSASWRSKAQPARASRGTRRPRSRRPRCSYRKLSPREQVAGLGVRLGVVGIGHPSKAQPARASRGTSRCT